MVRELKPGDLYAGRPLEFVDDESMVRGIAKGAKRGEASKYYPPLDKQKGSDEAREKMAKVRAAKGKSRDVTGILSTEGDDK